MDIRCSVGVRRSSVDFCSLTAGLCALAILARFVAAQPVVVPTDSVHRFAESAARFTEIPGCRSFSGQVLAKPRPGVRRADLPMDQTRILRWVAETGEIVLRTPAGMTDAQFAIRLESSGAFEYVEPDWLVTLSGVPDDPLYLDQWHHARIDSPTSWSFWTGSPAITIAVVDSGIDPTHPELAPLLISGYNAVNKLTQAAGGDVSDVSSIGHGTGVAGCAAAIGNNGQGVAGIGWAFRVMPIRASNEPQGTAVLSNVLDGCRWAADHGAKVINASYSGVSASSVGTTGAYVRNRGAILVWSSGNNGAYLGNSSDWPDVVIVGATDTKDAKPSWASYGPALDMVAPGTTILTTTRGGGYATYDGTSFASPMVAGALALAWSVNPSLSRQAVIDAVLGQVEDLGVPGEDDLAGRGLLNAGRSALAAWRESFVIVPPILEIAAEGPLSDERWPIRPDSEVELIRFAENLNAPALPLIGGERLESTSIDLSGLNPEFTQLRVWTFSVGVGTIDVEYLNESGEWSLLVDPTGEIQGPFEHAWSLPPDASHSRFAVRITPVISSGGLIYVSSLTVGERCPSDFDTSGWVDTNDFTEFVTAFEMGLPSADVDFSGFVDTDDFTAFVAAFDRGC
jgi:Subtilase family